MEVVETWMGILFLFLFAFGFYLYVRKWVRAYLIQFEQAEVSFYEFPVAVQAMRNEELLHILGNQAHSLHEDAIKEAVKRGLLYNVM